MQDGGQAYSLISFKINSLVHYRQVRYEKVRSLIKTGDILACEGNAVYSVIIKKWGGFKVGFGW